MAGTDKTSVIKAAKAGKGGLRVAVTGGSGRIGGELVKRLTAAGHKVTVIDPKHGELKGVEYLTAPINEIGELNGIDAVFHLAASIDYKASLQEMRRRNVIPTKQLLDLCRGCKHFILMSTTSVYAESGKPITEETPTKPYSNYGESKLECEGLVAKSKIPYTILRSSQVFGPDFEEGYVQVLKRIQSGKMRIIGRGDNHIPLIHVSDLADALLLVMQKRPDAIGQVFNVDGGYKKTQNEFMGIAAKALSADPPASHMNPGAAKLIAKLTGKGPSLMEYFDKLAKDRQISIEKIAGIGFKPKVGLEAGIRECIEAFRKRGLLQ